MKSRNQEPVTVHSEDSPKGNRKKSAMRQKLEELHEFYIKQEIYRIYVLPNEPCCSNDRMARDLRINSDDLSKYLFKNQEIPADVAERIKHLHSIKLKNVDIKKAKIFSTCDINTEVALSLADIALINIGLKSISQKYDINMVTNALDSGVDKIIGKMGDDVLLSNGIQLFNLKTIYGARKKEGINEN